MLAGAKGSLEYDYIMQKLQEENYKHQEESTEPKRAAEPQPQTLRESTLAKEESENLIQDGPINSVLPSQSTT
jgi:hypothetical protein